MLVFMLAFLIALKMLYECIYYLLIKPKVEKARAVTQNITTLELLKK